MLRPTLTLDCLTDHVRFAGWNGRTEENLIAHGTLVFRAAHLRSTTKNDLSPFLISTRKGMINCPAHGELAFTVPLFDAFMRRAMPEFAPGNQSTK